MLEELEIFKIDIENRYDNSEKWKYFSPDEMSGGWGGCKKEGEPWTFKPTYVGDNPFIIKRKFYQDNGPNKPPYPGPGTYTFPIYNRACSIKECDAYQGSGIYNQYDAWLEGNCPSLNHDQAENESWFSGRFNNFYNIASNGWKYTEANRMIRAIEEYRKYPTELNFKYTLTFIGSLSPFGAVSKALQEVKQNL